MFALAYHPAVAHDLKHLPRQTASYILDEIIPAIQHDPYQGIRLHGILRDFYKYVCSISGVSYRIIYQVQPKHVQIVILLIGPRQNLYERLLRRLR